MVMTLIMITDGVSCSLDPALLSSNNLSLPTPPLPAAIKTKKKALTKCILNNINYIKKVKIYAFLCSVNQYNSRLYMIYDVFMYMICCSP